MHLLVYLVFEIQKPEPGGNPEEKKMQCQNRCEAENLDLEGIAASQMKSE